MKLYIAGPMRGRPEMNFESFDQARDILEMVGHEVVSPADIDRDEGPATLSEIIMRDVSAILGCDGIVLLPGHESSPGASAERAIAHWMGLKIFLFNGGDLHKYHPVDKDLSGGWEPAKIKPNMVVGLCGKARSGKDTVARFLVEKHGFQKLSFAAAVKDSALALDPLVEWRSDAWAPKLYVRLSYVVKRAGWDRAKESADVRRLLQRMGTEAGRKIHGEDCWANILDDKIYDARKRAPVVITDVRFQNEAKVVEAYNGYVVKIDRPSKDEIAGADHISETELDGIDTGWQILNTGSLQGLEEDVDTMHAHLISDWEGRSTCS